jgi:hypothetical protein
MTRCSECNVRIELSPYGWLHMAVGVDEVLRVLRCKRWASAQAVPADA